MADESYLDYAIRRANYMRQFVRRAPMPARKIEDLVASLDWHVVHRTANSEVITDLILEMIGRPVHVIAKDYDYFGRISTVFPKFKSGQFRCVVEDEKGRLFIHNLGQLRDDSLGDKVDALQPDQGKANLRNTP